MSVADRVKSALDAQAALNEARRLAGEIDTLTEAAVRQLERTASRDTPAYQSVFNLIMESHWEAWHLAEALRTGEKWDDRQDGDQACIDMRAMSRAAVALIGARMQEWCDRDGERTTCVECLQLAADQAVVLDELFQKGFTFEGMLLALQAGEVQ